MQKRVAAARGLDHGFHRQHVVARHAGVVVDALRAVGAVFRTATGLDGEERAHLHAVRGVEAAMHLLRAEQQVHEGQVEQRLHFGKTPVVAQQRLGM
jgi:hypothetical protein